MAAFEAKCNVDGLAFASTPKLDTLDFAPSIKAFNAPLYAPKAGIETAHVKTWPKGN